MRKLMTLTFIGCMCFGLVGCGGGGGGGAGGAGGASAVGGATGGAVAGGAGGGGTGAAGGAGGAAGADNSPVDLCTDAVGIICATLFQCPGNLGTTNGYADLNDCKQRLGAQDRCIPENADCAEGQTYQPAKAPACIAAYRAVTCERLVSDMAVDIYGTPAECQQVCQ